MSRETRTAAAHRAADDRGQRGLSEFGDISDCLDAVCVQLLRGLDANTPQPSHR